MVSPGSRKTGPSSPEDPAHRNAKAVSRLFARQQQAPRAASQPARHSARAAASHAHQATASEVVGRTLVSSAQPDWVHVQRRDMLQDPCHDIPSHVSQQLELAVSMNTITGGDSAQALAYATSTHPREAARAVGPVSSSCFGLQLAKSRHAHALRPSQGVTAHELSGLDERQRAAYHHQQAILRYEQSLPRRRAVDPYVHLTPAQQSTSVRIPNGYTAQRLSERDGGRFVLDNTYRQQLRGGVPSMTRVMQGEYYYPTVTTEGHERPSGGARDGRRGGAGGGLLIGGATRSPSSSGARVDFIAANKRHVHTASRINHDAHAQQQYRSRSAKPYLACPCGS